jgi:hypothetical protein
MEFLNSIGIGIGINSSLLRPKFLSGFLPSFSVYKMLFMNRLEFSCFVDFLQGFLQPGMSMVFFKMRQQKEL